MWKLKVFHYFGHAIFFLLFQCTDFFSISFCVSRATPWHPKFKIRKFLITYWYVEYHINNGFCCFQSYSAEFFSACRIKNFAQKKVIVLVKHNVLAHANLQWMIVQNHSRRYLCYRRRHRNHMTMHRRTIFWRMLPFCTRIVIYRDVAIQYHG